MTLESGMGGCCATKEHSVISRTHPLRRSAHRCRIEELQVQHFYKADPAYITGAAKGLGLNIERIKASAAKEVAAD